MYTNLINYADDIELYIPCENIDESILQTITLLGTLSTCVAR